MAVATLGPYTDQLNLPLATLPSTSLTAAQTNAAAVVTLAADANRGNIIGTIVYSYSAAPTGGLLTVEDGSGVTVFQVDVALGDVQVITFSPPLLFSANTATIVTLAAGGSGIKGKVNVVAWKLN